MLRMLNARMSFWCVCSENPYDPCADAYLTHVPFAYSQRTHQFLMRNCVCRWWYTKLTFEKWETLCISSWAKCTPEFLTHILSRRIGHYAYAQCKHQFLMRILSIRIKVKAYAMMHKGKRTRECLEMLWIIIEVRYKIFINASNWLQSYPKTFFGQLGRVPGRTCLAH
jgi:uncharacterized protein (DUF486 family)